MESISEVLKEPIVPFAVLLVVILAVPPVFERLRLPGLLLGETQGANTSVLSGKQRTPALS